MSVAYSQRKLGVVLGVVMSTASHALNALSFSAVSVALLPRPPSLSQNLLMAPLVLLTAIVPLPFGALGLSEQVSDDLFRLLGHPMGALTMLAYRLVSLGVTCVSIGVYLTSSGVASEETPEPSPALTTSCESSDGT